MSQTKWFVAVLVVQSRVEDAGIEARLVDLQYRLVRAPHPEQAYTRALELGRDIALAYKNAAGEQVAWEFSGLHDLHEIEDVSLTDGTEVYSRRVRDDPRDLVLPKSRLAVFWIAANKDRTARELLDNE